MTTRDPRAHNQGMELPLAQQVQPLIDAWLASDEGVIAELEYAMTQDRAAA